MVAKNCKQNKNIISRSYLLYLSVNLMQKMKKFLFKGIKFLKQTKVSSERTLSTKVALKDVIESLSMTKCNYKEWKRV